MEQSMYKLISSNENKLNEFRRFGIHNIGIEKGRDLAEVDSDPLTVIIYKALEAGAFRIVEDTSLHVEGEDVGANVKWMLDNLDVYEGKKAKWETLVARNDGERIDVFRGVIEGVLVHRFDEPKGFGFDGFFVPNGSDKTLYELEEQGNKDNFSARKNAIDAWLKGNVYHVCSIKNIHPWTGNMQNN